MMKKLLLVLLLASSFSIAADSANADKAFRDLDNEFGEGGANPNDPSVKEDKYKESTTTQPTQDRYAPRDDRQAPQTLPPRYADRYVPAEKSDIKAVYQYVGYGIASGYVSEKYTDSIYGNTTLVLNNLIYESAQYHYGIFMPKAHMKLEVSLAGSTHTDTNGISISSTDVNYDLMIGHASMNRFIGSFAYVKLGLAVQSLGQSSSNTSLAGFRVGAGYSLILASFLEAYADYTFMSTTGTSTSNNTDAAILYSMFNYGINFLF